MVEVTYQDYLKYKKYLEEKEKEKKPKKTKKEQEVDIELGLYLIEKLEELGKRKKQRENKETNEEGEKSNFLEEESEQYNVIENDETNRIISIEKQKENHQKHDKLFKDLFNNKKEFICFIKSFVDKNIKLREEKVEKCNSSFITKDYRERHSDIVYKIKDENVYFLIEHQSTVSYNMPYRIMEYCYEIIREAIDKKEINKKGYKLPKVIPIVLYTGDKKWNASQYLEQVMYEQFEDIGIILKYILIDANNYSKETLFKSNSMVGFGMQAERCETNEDILEVIRVILEVKTKEEDAEDVKRMIHYLVKDRLGEKGIDDINKKIKERKVEEIMITVAERLEKNDKKILEEGIAQGIAQGVAQGVAQIVQKMIDSGMELKDIQKITGFTKETIENLTKNE